MDDNTFLEIMKALDQNKCSNLAIFWTADAMCKESALHPYRFTFYENGLVTWCGIQTHIISDPCTPEHEIYIAKLLKEN